MINSLKKVITFFFLYIKRKIVTLKEEKYFALVWASSFID